MNFSFARSRSISAILALWACSASDMGCCSSSTTAVSASPAASPPPPLPVLLSVDTDAAGPLSSPSLKSLVEDTADDPAGRCCQRDDDLPRAARPVVVCCVMTHLEGAVFGRIESASMPTPVPFVQQQALWAGREKSAREARRKERGRGGRRRREGSHVSQRHRICITRVHRGRQPLGGKQCEI